MATNAKVLEPITAAEDLAHMREVDAPVLPGAYDRIRAEVLRAEQLGIIDERGNRISKEWPQEMRALTASSRGAPMDLDDYDRRF